MRPFVDRAQQLAAALRALPPPLTRPGVAALGLGLRLAALPVVERIGGRLFTPPAEAVDLPDYSHLQR